MEKRIERADGSILIGYIPDTPGGTAIIHTIIVPEHLRGKGIGSALYDEFQQDARGARARKIQIVFDEILSSEEDIRSMRRMFRNRGFRDRTEFREFELHEKKLPRHRERHRPHR